MTFGIDTVVNEWHTFACARGRGKTGVMADRDKIEFRLFNSSSIFNITLREELFSLPKKKTKHVVLSWFHGASHLSQVPWREVEGHYSPFFLFNLTFFPSGKANQKKRTWYWKLEINRICAAYTLDQGHSTYWTTVWNNQSNLHHRPSYQHVWCRIIY